VAACPFDVFEVRRMDVADFEALGLLGKLRTTAHRRRTAYAVRAEQCQECGKCVAACPEEAITLRPGP
jgi:NAD-dependent dihydropyrimidine dehydrogenase PreA subunit